MKVFAISDLHLSVNNPKPMDIFGPVWENYLDKIFADWKEKVSEDDLVLLAGDFSWAMKLEDTKDDFALLADLPGKKVMVRGNHDYWWKSISAVRGILPKDFYAIQNDAIKIGNYIICGTRLWNLPTMSKTQSEEDEKIYKRELLRLEMTLQAANKLKADNEKIICMSVEGTFQTLSECCPQDKLKKVIMPEQHHNEAAWEPVFRDFLSMFLT